jgi:hypothetical protein
LGLNNIRHHKKKQATSSSWCVAISNQSSMQAEVSVLS